VGLGTDWRRAVAERRASLRGRVVGSAAAVVGIALVIGAILFVVLFRWALLDSLRGSTEADASTIADRVSSTGEPRLTEAERDDDDRLLQLVAADGRVLDSNELGGSVGVDVVDEWVTIAIDDEQYLVVVDDAESANGEVSVVVGAELDELDQSLASVIQLLVVAVPLLLALVSLVTWLVVGRALRPVEAMRRELEAITATSLRNRVDEPATGDEIHRLAVTMNGMLERLETSQRKQAQFVSDASHELRSPLASLRQFAEVAQGYPGQVTAEELASAIRDEGGRLESIVRAMLLLARSDETDLDRARREVDIDDLLDIEARRLRATTELVIDATGVAATRVTAHRELLAQVLRNLVDNAARHARSRVAMTARIEGGHAVVTIEDDGDGIPLHERDRVFERFVRLDEARARESGGSGLGLAIVWEIVGQHGGTVRVVDGALGGACVELRLPVES